MKICKDGRIWGQNNKEADEHLGILSGRKTRVKKGGVKGSKNPMFGKTGKQSPNFGKKISVETRRKIGETCTGEKHWNWKGGITKWRAKIKSRIEHRLWREAVFARDNWTCQQCGKKGGWMNAHHIKSFADFPELRLAIDNGITLCLKCHKLTNNFGGRNTNKTNGN